MYLHIIGAPPIRNHRPTERQTDTRVKDLLASGVPPKGLEARAFTFGGTEGSMLGRRGWFNAVAKRFDIRGCHMVDIGHSSRFFNFIFCFLVFFR